jgi:hypothetical protein
MKVLYLSLSGQFLVIQPQQEKVYTSYLQLDLADVEPCVSGPKWYALFNRHLLIFGVLGEMILPRKCSTNGEELGIEDRF